MPSAQRNVSSPDSLDIPAPVNTTMAPARACRASIGLCMVTLPRNRTTLRRGKRRSISLRDAAPSVFLGETSTSAVPISVLSRYLPWGCVDWGEEETAMRLERFAANDGCMIRVQVGGHGPPIVLLHEWASNHRVWEPIAHRPADPFTVYRWDARGHHGHGDETLISPSPVSVERMADDLANLLEHFRLKRPTVGGHSMGALTLWAYIARHGCDRLGRIG